MEPLEFKCKLSKNYIEYKCNPKSELNITTLSSGIYFIRILTQEGIVVKKLMVSR